MQKFTKQEKLENKPYILEESEQETSSSSSEEENSINSREEENEENNSNNESEDDENEAMKGVKYSHTVKPIVKRRKNHIIRIIILVIVEEVVLEILQISIASSESIFLAISWHNRVMCRFCRAHIYQP